jgi:hypothetical protein
MDMLLRLGFSNFYRNLHFFDNNLIINNNVEDYRGVAILSAISKHFELLVDSGMYKRLEKSDVYQSTWLHEEPMMLIPSIRIFQRLLIASPQDACGWDLICQGESRK